MKFIHHIIHTAREDLLARAVASIKPLWPLATIIDNSYGGIRGSYGLPVIRTPAQLSCAQAMNFQQRRAVEAGADAWGYQHSDAEAAEGTAEKFLAAIEAAGDNWAALFTTYDILSAYSTAAVAKIGPWDIHFPAASYTLDFDWFHRARSRGYEIIDTQLPVIHLDGGSVTRKIAGRARQHQSSFRFNVDYYWQKWGGPHEQEQYARPWDYYCHKVYGLHRTGTNLAAKLIAENFDSDLVSDFAPGWTGWKHSAHEPGEWALNCDFILCVKHPLAWLVSVYEFFSRPDATETFGPMSFGEFLHRPQYGFANPVEWWNSTYRGWLRDLPADQTIIVRAEDQLVGQPRMLERFAAMGNRRKENPWKLCGDQVDVDGEIRGAVRRDYYRNHEYLSAFSPELLEFAKGAIDQEIVKRMGY